MPRPSFFRSTLAGLSRRASRREDSLRSRITELEEELRAVRLEEGVIGRNLDELQHDSYLAREILGRRIRPLVVPGHLERCAETVVGLIDLADAAREREASAGDRAIQRLRACGRRGLGRTDCVRLVSELERMRRPKPSLHPG